METTLAIILISYSVIVSFMVIPWILMFLVVATMSIAGIEPHTVSMVLFQAQYCLTTFFEGSPAVAGLSL